MVRPIYPYCTATVIRHGGGLQAGGLVLLSSSLFTIVQPEREHASPLLTTRRCSRRLELSSSSPTTSPPIPLQRGFHPGPTLRAFTDGILTSCGSGYLSTARNLSLSSAFKQQQQQSIS